MTINEIAIEQVFILSHNFVLPTSNYWYYTTIRHFEVNDYALTLE